MFEFFKRSYPQLDIDDIILFTEAAFKIIKELKSENKALNLKVDFFAEALEEQSKIIEMLKNEKKLKLVKFKNIHQN